MPPKKIEIIPVARVFEVLNQLHQACTSQLEEFLDTQTEIDTKSINRVTVERRVINKIRIIFENITTKEEG